MSYHYVGYPPRHRRPIAQCEGPSVGLKQDASARLLESRRNDEAPASGRGGRIGPVNRAADARCLSGCDIKQRNGRPTGCIEPVVRQPVNTEEVIKLECA